MKKKACLIITMLMVFGVGTALAGKAPEFLPKGANVTMVKNTATNTYTFTISGVTVTKIEVYNHIRMASNEDRSVTASGGTYSVTTECGQGWNFKFQGSQGEVWNGMTGYEYMNNGGAAWAGDGVATMPVMFGGNKGAEIMPFECLDPAIQNDMKAKKTIKPLFAY